MTVRRPQARACARVGNQRSIVSALDGAARVRRDRLAVARDGQARPERDHGGIDRDDSPADREAGRGVAAEGVAGRGDRQGAGALARRGRSRRSTPSDRACSLDRLRLLRPRAWRGCRVRRSARFFRRLLPAQRGDEGNAARSGGGESLGGAFGLGRERLDLADAGGELEGQPARASSGRLARRVAAWAPWSALRSSSSSRVTASSSDVAPRRTAIARALPPRRGCGGGRPEAAARPGAFAASPRVCCPSAPAPAAALRRVCASPERRELRCGPWPGGNRGHRG